MALSPTARPPARHPAVSAALQDCRRAFWSVAIFSGLVNLLMLAGPLYMLQIYDRVLASHSVPTLVALSIMLVMAYAFQGLLDMIRTRVVVRSAGLLDRHLGGVVHGAVLRLAVFARQSGDAHQPVRDLDQIRAFLTSPGPIAIVDLPWMPVFLAICFLIHPWVGVLSLVGAVVLFSMTLLTERASRAPSREVARGASQRSAMVEASRRNGETVMAMGLGGVLGDRWHRLNEDYLGSVERSTDVVGAYGGTSKVLRMVLQSAILGLGAFLVLRQEISPGSMIAASIMMARALAPIETAIANWRGFVAARDSIHRLSEVLARVGVDPIRTGLPAPHLSVDVENLAVAAPEGRSVIVANVSFRLQAGDVLGIVGPSGSGKTSLVRALVNVWRPARGSVRIDGASLDQWDPNALGPHMGYLAQSVELFDGTVAENIARMSLEPDADRVVAAARAAGAHELILRLPNGYDTRIGDAGSILSAGQRQRVALARALYGDPFLIVLDEPNANLDSEGEAALMEAIRNVKARGGIVVLIAHRIGILAVCDKVLVVRDGLQQAFGPRDDVLRKMSANQAPPQPTPAQAPVPVRPAAVQSVSMGGSLKIVGSESGGSAA